MSTPKIDDGRWFSEEVLPHEASLRSYLHSLFPSLPDIDDLVQEAYARLIHAKGKGRISYAKAFLFATARNLALDIFRRRKIVTMESMGDMSELPILDDGPDASAAIDRQQDLALLADAVRALPDRCREVVTLRALYGLSHKEIAANLGISEHTVKAQVAKGMRRFAEYFQAHGGLDCPRPAAGKSEAKDAAGGGGDT